MAIAFRSVATVGVDSGALTCSKPTGTVDGDLMIATVSTGQVGEISAPAGWTLIDEELSAGNCFVYRKIASSEGSSYTFGTMTVGSVMAIVTFMGNHATPLDQHSVRYSTPTSVTATGTAITPTQSPDNLVVMVVGTREAVTVSGYAIVNNNPTWTEHADLYQTAGGGSGQIAIASGAYNAASDTGTPTATLSASKESSVFLFNIKSTDPVIAAGFTAVAAVPAPGITADATIDAGFTAAASVPAPSVASADPEWSNTSKNSASPSNTSKNASTATNTSKNSSSWTNTSKS